MKIPQFGKTISPIESFTLVKLVLPKPAP